MSPGQIIVAAFVFGFGAQLGEWLLFNVNEFTRAFVIGIVNRRAAMLRMHHAHCPRCAQTMVYCCPPCGYVHTEKEG